MTDVLLVNPANVLDQYGAAKEMAPLGMLSIAAFLQAQGYEVRVLDLEFAHTDVGRVVEEERPIIVGIGGTSTTRFAAFEIARAVKSANSTPVTVYGGCHATFTADDTLRHVPEIDVVVAGEGELVMANLMDCLRAGDNWQKVRGISYREDGHICHNAPAQRIENLDALPVPARHLVDMAGYTLRLDQLGKRAASIITSRGCPVNCAFCSASAMFGRQITFRSAQNVVDEMEDVANRYGVDGFKIFDSTFTLSRKHAESICDEIIRRDLAFSWECEIRVNTVDFALLQKMKKAGCYLVDFGIESASDRVLKRMHKGITLAQAEQVLDWTHDLGIAQKVFFTIGHIEETIQDAEQTLQFIQRNLHRIAKPAIGIGIRIYPGTEVERYALEKGYLADFSWSQPFSEPRNTFLDIAPNIPVFIQPQLGFDALLDLKRRALAAQASNPLFVIRRIFTSHSGADIRKYARSLRKMIRPQPSGGPRPPTK